MMRFKICSVLWVFSFQARAEGLTFEGFSEGLGAGKILLGCIIFFLILSIYLFKRIPGGALWNHRKKIEQYEKHIREIDRVLARAQSLSKQKDSKENDLIEQKAQLAAEITEILKKSPLNEVSDAAQSVSKLSGKSTGSMSKIDSRYRQKK